VPRRALPLDKCYFVQQGFKDVNSEAALKKAVAVAHNRSEMKDGSTQTAPVDKVDAHCRYCIYISVSLYFLCS